jgi:lipopolysaccharide transport system ATP-binding protein
MSSNQPAIAVRGLSKSYTIRRNAAKHTTLADAVVDRIKHPFRRTEKEVFWALRDVSFEVAPGEIVGIIGRNGAGKSTLLKILSRITRPTSGEVELHGRVGSLLEVGTGFHQELTGRENIYLSGTILGMKRREIREQFDAIVDFSGVEQFLDTPVKRYSSGMYVRLAFAVAAHLNPEILIVDEVLAVGDLEFQRKCLGKMQHIAVSGRTVLLVSHNMQTIKSLCRSAIVLQNGRLTEIQPVEDALQQYGKEVPINEGPTPPKNSLRLRQGTGEYRFTNLRSSREVYTPNEAIKLSFQIERLAPGISKFFIGIQLSDQTGCVITQADSRLVMDWIVENTAYEGSFTVNRLWLKPGDYFVEGYIACAGYIDRYENALRFSISSELPYPHAANSDATSRGVVFCDYEYDIKFIA